MEQSDHWSAFSVLQLLNELEWRETDSEFNHYCPYCGCRQENGHEAGCRIAWHIDQLKKEVLNQPGMI